MQVSNENPDKAGSIALRVGSHFASFLKTRSQSAIAGKLDMFCLSKKHIYSIGVDIGDDALKVAQLGSNGKGINLIASGSQDRPADVKPGSGNWQRWAIEAIRQLTANGKFRGKAVIATIPASECLLTI